MCLPGTECHFITQSSMLPPFLMKMLYYVKNIVTASDRKIGLYFMKDLLPFPTHTLQGCQHNNAVLLMLSIVQPLLEVL